MQSMENEKKCRMLTPADGLPCRYYLYPTDRDKPGFCRLDTRFFCDEALKHKLPPFSFSSVTDFVSCRMKYYYRVIQALQVKPQYLPEALKFGRAWDSFTRSRFEEGYDYLPAIQELQMTLEQIARISALMRAYVDLGIKNDGGDGFLGCQYEISVPLGVKCNIRGFVDRAYEDYIVESKTSSNPDFYFQKENIQYQLSTYFLANKAWDYAVLEVVRIPRVGKSEEDPEKLGQRIYGDILSRPSHYFIGWNRERGTFGKKFWRGEFDLDEMFRTYRFVYEDLRRTVINNSWYPNRLACHVPAPCPYLPIERTGVVSDEVYRRGNKPIIMWMGD